MHVDARGRAFGTRGHDTDHPADAEGYPEGHSLRIPSCAPYPYRIQVNLPRISLQNVPQRYYGGGGKSLISNAKELTIISRFWFYTMNEIMYSLYVYICGGL